MAHIGDVLKNRFSSMPKAVKSILVAIVLLFVIFLPSISFAYEYTQETIQYVYHEAPDTFTVDALGQVSGVTVGGTMFSQVNIANEYGVRLQRFEIGYAYWYVSDKGVIWANNDLAALSIYLSRIV